LIQADACVEYEQRSLVVVCSLSKTRTRQPHSHDEVRWPARASDRIARVIPSSSEKDLRFWREGFTMELCEFRANRLDDSFGIVPT
jgi:hypothetical protein